MRIPPETIRSLVGLHTERVGRSQAAGLGGNVSSVSRALTTDTLSLSEEATLLNALKEGVRAMPDVDQARVDKVCQEMADGTFQVVPERVAEGSVLELSGLV